MLYDLGTCLLGASKLALLKPYFFAIDRVFVYSFLENPYCDNRLEANPFVVGRMVTMVLAEDVTTCSRFVRFRTEFLRWSGFSLGVPAPEMNPTMTNVRGTKWEDPPVQVRSSVSRRGKHGIEGSFL
jgi:hypothetical protein